ncbi:DUF4221 family protein [Algoriphagus aquatilis]|uniref:DUF4221 family protein n=1 Tax=Algoriphagus aquatilis TaxID=490186 RepID=A0ABW0BT82_9BACT
MTDFKNSYSKRFIFNVSKEKRGFVPLTSHRSGIIFYKEKVYLTNPMAYIPSVKVAPDFFKDYNNSRFIFEYDILRDSIFENNMLFPIEYNKAIYSDYFNFMSQWFVDDKILYSFPLSDSLIEYAISSKLSKRIYAGFSKRNKFKSEELASSQTDLIDVSSNEQFNSFIGQFNYDKILYDEYRKLFYRFIEFPIPNNVLEIPARIKPLGILIFDQDFNKIGEYDLGYGKYTISHCFISSKGLNLINYEKIISEESSITFDIFDFSMPEQL